MNANITIPLPKRKVNFITVEEKYKAIKALERKETTLPEICEKLDVGKSTVFGWITQRDKIIDEFENNPLISKRMRTRGPKTKEIEEILADWIKVNRSSGADGVALSATLIKQKAQDFAKILGDNEFQANNGWFDKFKKKFQHLLADDVESENDKLMACHVDESERQDNDNEGN